MCRERVEFSKWKVSRLDVEQLMPRKCTSTILWQNPIIQYSMHQIFTHMYFTVSRGPSFKENLTGFLHTPPPAPLSSNDISPHFTIEPLPSVSLPIIPSLQPSKKLASKFITSLSGKQSQSAAWEFNLTIRPLKWMLLVEPKTQLFSNPCSENLHTLHFPKVIQHKLIYSSTTKTI